MIGQLLKNVSSYWSNFEFVQCCHRWIEDGKINIKLGQNELNTQVVIHVICHNTDFR